MDDDKELFGCDCVDDDCDCGCGEQEEEIITLTLEDGTEIECAVIAIFPIDDKDYIALLPLENIEDGEVYLYRYEEHEDGTFDLLSIETDNEYEEVTKVFDEILDEAEFDELFDEDEDED